MQARSHWLTPDQPKPKSYKPKGKSEEPFMVLIRVRENRPASAYQRITHRKTAITAENPSGRIVETRSEESRVTPVILIVRKDRIAKRHMDFVVAATVPTRALAKKHRTKILDEINEKVAARTQAAIPAIEL